MRTCGSGASFLLSGDAGVLGCIQGPYGESSDTSVTYRGLPEAWRTQFNIETRLWVLPLQQQITISISHPLELQSRNRWDADTCMFPAGNTSEEPRGNGFKSLLDVPISCRVQRENEPLEQTW